MPIVGSFVTDVGDAVLCVWAKQNYVNDEDQRWSGAPADYIFAFKATMPVVLTIFVLLFRKGK